ncbi:CMP-N-acetylneuraminate-beta-galactosamide-alpha-2,3-sialyltransferase 1-like [Centropristis striata]|uniref:CMP-N-acetylneuraminate-beta-galactosamide- alpha-2,3-sialyltransferase 1-like n=1 Tax=Centropristis striata TaxID=184440 RepID=UPI0027E04915|nr:CMP-N-acetylneuraminate-beta-galactosamide-alpha-2,3-sialyltransferase 1-like [Centropristis striata]
MISRLGKTRAVIAFLCIACIGILSRSSFNLSVDSLGDLNNSHCACPTCYTRDDDPWFGELIKAAPPPFLSKNYTTPEEDYDWWKRLQWQGYDYAFYQKTVKDVFERFPHVPDVIKYKPGRCRTCAVVGNSGNLKGSRYGPLIDFHDIVIRINRGRTKGYEADVGTKTTHRVMYPESAFTSDNTTHLVFVPFKIKDLQWLLGKFEPSDANSGKIANRDLVMILNPAFMKYVYEQWLDRKGRYPSTGFITLALSFSICDQVDVFGFGADSDGNWNHYFETTNRHLRTGPHPGGHEYGLIETLHKKEKIGFYRGF